MRSLLAEGESSKVFRPNSDGMWFDAISKAKDGRLWSAHKISKSNLDHIQCTQSILSSPPKKRTFVSVPEPNPHHPTQQCTQSFVTVTSVGRPQGATMTPNPEFQKRFTEVEDRVKAQVQWNVKIEHKIGSLEDICQN